MRARTEAARTGQKGIAQVDPYKISPPPIVTTLAQTVQFKNLPEAVRPAKEVCRVDGRLVDYRYKPQENNWESQGRFFATSGTKLVEATEDCKIVATSKQSWEPNSIIGPIRTNGYALKRDSSLFSMSGNEKKIKTLDEVKGKYRPDSLSWNAGEIAWAAINSHTYLLQDIITNSFQMLPFNTYVQKIKGFSLKDDLIAYVDNDLLTFAQIKTHQIIKTAIPIHYAGASGQFVIEPKAPYRWVGTADPLMHENFELFVDTNAKATKFEFEPRVDVKSLSVSSDWRYMALAITAGKLVAYRSIKSEYFIYVLDLGTNSVAFKKSLGVTNFDNNFGINTVVFLNNNRFAYNAINVGGERDLPKSDKIVVEELQR